MKYLILIAIIVLAVGCGKKKVATEVVEPVAEVNPIGEKVQEVKDEAKTEESIAETKPKPEGVNEKELEEREGIYYLVGSDAPYTGKVFDLWKNGKKRWEANYKDGKKEGLEVQFYENGQKRIETNSKDGMDKITRWYKNGQKEGEENYKDGSLDGLSIFWYPNGQKGNEGVYKDGIMEGIHKMWHENGQKSWEGNYKDGQLVEGSVKYWNTKGEPVNSITEAIK